MKRFWNKVIKTSYCWYWIASLRNKRIGYGSFKYQGKVYDSHRFVWFLTTGLFPQNCVLHHCDNKRCVNPNHLFLGSYKDNYDDMCKKGRRADFRGEGGGATKLSSQQIVNIRDTYSMGVKSQRDLAKEYGVHHSTIGYILNNKTWKHL